jgi:hypothetical protein
MQGEVAPLAVFGLLQHETKLSVVNFSVRKAAALEEPLPNKTELLLVTGLRCTSANVFLHSQSHQHPCKCFCIYLHTNTPTGASADLCPVGCMGTSDLKYREVPPLKGKCTCICSTVFIQHISVKCCDGCYIPASCDLNVWVMTAIKDLH